MENIIEVGYVGLTRSTEARFNMLQCRVVEVDVIDTSRPYRVEILEEGYYQGMRYWVNGVIDPD